MGKLNLITSIFFAEPEAESFAELGQGEGLKRTVLKEKEKLQGSV